MAHPAVQSGFEDEVFQVIVVGEAVVAVGAAGEVLQISGNDMLLALRAAVAFEHERSFVLIISIFHIIIFALLFEKSTIEYYLI